MVNIFDFALISIMILIILIVLISFFIAIPIFTIKMYRRMSKEMSSAKRLDLDVYSRSLMYVFYLVPTSLFTWKYLNRNNNLLVLCLKDLKIT